LGKATHGAISQERQNAVDLSPREIKAVEIADRFRIVESSGKWFVPSQTHPTSKYAVRIVVDYAECECPDYELRRDLCKHILAVQLTIKREHNADGTTTVTETFTVARRVTYLRRNGRRTTQRRLRKRITSKSCLPISAEIFPRFNKKGVDSEDFH
jgi:hypothetical protein